MVRALIKSNHMAMLEHYSFSVKFICDRGVSHEIVRHRVASYAQESTRYCNYNKSGDVAFIRPVFFAEDTPEMDNWLESCMRAEKTYNYLISEGRTPQEARSVLPNSLKTEVVMTANLREWRHFLSLRACGSTGKPHPQMLEVAVPLLKELRERVPVVFDDLEPMEWETIAKVQKAGGEWSYANQSALTRSRGLFEQIGEQIKALGQKEQITFRQGLSNIYTDQFLRQVYDLGQSLTVKANFNRLNPALIQKTLDYPWSGAMFSDRLWQDKERLGRNLRVGLTQSMILGEGIPQITDRINKGIDTARYNAERVARTETKRVTYCAHDDVYKDTGVEELRYRCANGGDSRTCQYCRADNGKVFKRGEEPTLPRHPNCRCVYIPVVSDTFEDNELNELTGSIRGAENYEKWREAEAKKQEEVKPVEKVSTKAVEKELKENPTPVPEQIKLTDYPQAFYATKPEAKNTQALLDYMNSKTSTDPNVVALYTKMDKLCDGLSDEVVLKVTHGEHRVKRSWNKNFDYVVDVGIPKINPNYIGTYDTNLHEEMHFLDMQITVKDNKDRLPSKMFSQSYKPLVEAFDKATPVIGDKAKKLFEDFAKECDIIYKKQQETFNTQHEDLKEQYRSGKIDWKKYNSLYKKLSKEVNEEADNKRRALFGGGVSGLQDIYDAVSKGTFRDTGQVTYGHGSAYYTDRRRTNPNCSESLANYASLCVGHPELIDILAEDYPEIVTALRGCVEAMLKEVPK